MVVSCLNHALISDSVAGTSVNATKLFIALTPLCPKPSATLAPFAENIGTVFIAYFFGFLPWGFQALFDFISAKWKTVRATRRLGHLHLVFSVVPMLVVIAYAIVQAMAEDYKEMMTAVIASLLMIHHMARTVWGLVQLHEYVSWCKDTVECIRASRPKSIFRGRHSSENRDREIVLDTALMVNEDIVDNEFTGRDIPVSLTWPHAKLRVSNVEVCTVRWAAAFQCSLGHVWESWQSKQIQDAVIKFLSMGLFLFDGPHSDSLLLCFKQLSKKWASEVTHSGAFGGNIENELVRGYDSFRLYKFEFDNVVSTYPSEGMAQFNRADARIEHVELVLSVKNMGHQILNTLESRHKQNIALIGSYRWLEDGWNLLQNQLGVKNQVEYILVHWFYKLMMIPMFPVQFNAFALQASVAVDSHVSAFIGFKGKLQDEHLVIGDEFRSCKVIFEKKGVPISYRFLGTSLDAVRALLAQWVLNSQRPIDPLCWRPVIPSGEFCFSLDYDLYRDIEDPYLYWFQQIPLISMCQCATLRAAKEAHPETMLPGSLSLIIAFLASYPVLNITRPVFDQDERKGVFFIDPLLAPQDLEISVTVCESTQSVSIKLECVTENMRFEWQNWINSAMAIMRSYNEIARKSGKFERTEPFEALPEHFKIADLSRPVTTLNALHEDLPHLPGRIHTWTGWPMFDVRFCQFELNHWIELGGPLPAEETEAYKEYEERMNTARKTLTKVIN